MNLELEVGKTYTVIGISNALAVAMLTILSIERIQNGMNVVKEIQKGKKSKKESVVSVKDQLIFEGAEIPFTTDFNAVQDGISDTFSGSATFNLEGEGPIEEIRKFIETNNLNPKVDLGLIMYREVPVFPEMCSERVLQMTSKYPY